LPLLIANVPLQITGLILLELLPIVNVTVVSLREIEPPFSIYSFLIWEELLSATACPAANYY
jgi:hypothetical protein